MGYRWFVVVGTSDVQGLVLNYQAVLNSHHTCTCTCFAHYRSHVHSHISHSAFYIYLFYQTTQEQPYSDVLHFNKFLVA